MQHQFAGHNIDNKFTSWVSAMSQSIQEATIGHNPILPSVIHKSWGWPFLFIEFLFKDRLVALVSFVKIRRTWVSLPHFDHDSLWVDLDFLNRKSEILDDIIIVPEWINRFFYHRAFEILRKVNGDLIPGTIVAVQLDSHDFNKHNEKLTTKGHCGVMARNRYQVLPHGDNAKIIPVLTLTENHKIQFESFSSNVRRKIRKSVKNGIRVEIGGIELVDDFYKVYRNNIRSLGSFALPKRFFIDLFSGYKYGEARIFIARLRGVAIGGGILLSFSGYAENAWFCSLKNYNKYYVTYALVEAMIRFSMDSGCSKFSFGRSTVNSSGHIYKRQWSKTEVPLIMSSTKKIRLNPVKLTFVPRLIRLVPDVLLNRLDGLVSKLIY